MPTNPLDLVLDTWASLSHKKTLRRDPIDLESGNTKPPWMSDEDYRRICAYKLRLAYQRNVARFYIGENDRDDYREYGDAGLLVSQAVAALLGDEQTVVVDGASADQEPDPEAGMDQPGLETREKWLRRWVDKERLAAKLLESERQSVGLGDSVIVLGWSDSKQRVRAHVYDPGLYFPVLTDGDTDFPRRVHMLWEIPPEPWENPVSYRARIRRRTWELAPIEGVKVPDEVAPGVVRRVLTWLLPTDNSSYTDDYQLYDGDRFNPEGRIVRRYPWQPADEPDSAVTCFYSDATWYLDELTGDVWSVDALPMSKATFAVNEQGELLDRVDLRLDFVPVVHVPNTVAEQEHYGVSVIDQVAQLLDDISAGDTDLQASSATTGSPPIGLAGVNLPNNERVRVAPGEVWGLGENGRMSSLDTSPNLLALAKIGLQMLDRLSINARMPAVALGRVDPSAIPSGVALALTFTPMKSLIGEMRLVRSEKYPLVLKMVQRIAQSAAALEAGVSPRAELQLGNWVPSDLQDVVKAVAALLPVKAISTDTAVRMLIEAGLPIEDAQAEVERIRAESFAAARDLFEATGDENAALKFLGLPEKPVDTQQQAAATAAVVPQITLPDGTVLNGQTGNGVPQPTGA
jgi:hypothetical protein